MSDKISFKLPPQVRTLFNCFGSRDFEYRDEDLAAFLLPDGTTIDVGWSLSLDGAGRFLVCVFSDNWDNQLRMPFGTKSIDEVVAYVERVALELSETAA